MHGMFVMIMLIGKETALIALGNNYLLYCYFSGENMFFKKLLNLHV